MKDGERYANLTLLISGVLIGATIAYQSIWTKIIMFIIAASLLWWSNKLRRDTNGLD